MSAEVELGVIGAGAMAEAIVSAALRGGLLQPEDVLASDPSPARRELFSTSLGVAVTDDNARVAGACEVLLLAIKPQEFGPVSSAISRRMRADQAIVSIMAGVPCEVIESAFGQNTTRVLRIMPNLPMTIGAGVAGVCPGRHATADDIDFAMRLFEAGGKAVRIDDESLMDAVTAVSGSGPAYFYYFTEALIDGGIRAGLSRPVAELLARHTCLGAARMMIESGESPAVLREKVTSKGGTTAAALAHLHGAGVDQSIAQAVVAAFERGRELGHA